MNGLYAWVGGLCGMYAATLTVVFWGDRLFPPEPARELLVVTTGDYRRELGARVRAESALRVSGHANIELSVDNAILRDQVRRLSLSLPVEAPAPTVLPVVEVPAGDRIPPQNVPTIPEGE